MDNPALIREAKSGSGAAQKCLFDQFCPRMQILCRRYLRNPEDAEEAMLDGFFKFFKGLSSFQYQGEAALNSWLKRIMVNECLMVLRKKNVFPIVAEAVIDEIVLEETALDQLSAAEIFKMVVQLPVGYRTVFNLYAIEGWTHGEIAVHIGINEGTSKSQLSKARSLLQKMLLQKGTSYGRQKNG